MKRLSQTRSLLRILAFAGIALCLVLFGIWGALALHFRAPFDEAIRDLLSLGVLVVAALSVFALLRRSTWLALPALACFPALVFWWTGIEATNTRHWAGDVAQSVTAEIGDSRLVLSNVRNFRWTGDTTFEPAWETRAYDLDQLTHVDLLASHWDGENIAHMLVSFGFANDEQIVWSAEVRRVEGQEYQTVASMFKLSELIMIAGDERDLIGVRARKRGEDVRLYPLNLSPDIARKLLVSYARAANELASKPRWYNAVTDNCTTVILDLARTLAPSARYDWRVLLTGHFAEYAWDHGALDQSVPFETWRARASISALASAADMQDGRAFSRQIRTISASP